ncbi:hypothetical protein HAU32_09040 [Weissella confusa]|uniref:Polysaccharide biosynthesis protein C-terminal domain-containing protein n=1 Tax=Weissella fermenti TaxID=2987699 RepID=A0ABT6D3R3_9LACO|nr:MULTISPECIES: hypothetical protein [Weissella]MBJ7689113.1 hypothetical protein [Weissella confusa]MCW0926700.1 hypothetical protein [Weissella sp. LMG 11983]MDF9299130.1 hypothetical protein [Weissella sp. BK2]
MKKNVVGALTAKIGSFVMYGTDNLLVSKFIGLTMVGVYSNYILIFNSAGSLLSQMLNPFAASIANYVNDDSTSDTNGIFFKYMYLVVSMTLLVGTVLSLVTNIFISIWLGDEYILNAPIFAAMIFNWMINAMRASSLSFMTALGTYWEVRWKSLIESAVNLVVGLLLITQTNLGIVSVVIGTLSANIFINVWFEPMVVFRKEPSLNVKKYIVRYLFYAMIAAVVSVIPLLGLYSVDSPTFLNLMIVGVIAVIGFVVVYGILTFGFDESKYARSLIRKVILNKK